jgi:alpha-beta hydrolase superfamily lysophospholipase
MTHGEGELRTPCGAALYYQSWVPDDSPTAVLLIAHGLAEHSGRYAHFAAFFVARGYAVLALDHLGHGKSDGDRCHIGQFSEYTDGISLLLDRVREECSGAPVFLVGHSMGGLIAVRFLIEHQEELAGCVLSGAALRAPAEPSPIQRLMVKFFSKFIPKLRVMQLDASQVSRDPAVVDRYRNDPLVFAGKVTARLAEQLFSEMLSVRDQLGRIRLPVLILHGSEDGLTSPEGSKMLHEKVASKNKKLIIYEGLYHEIYNEPEQDEVMTDVANWLASPQ